VLSRNQNSSIIQASLHFSNDIQGKMERSHVGASSRARTFSMPLSLHIAYSVSLPVVIGTWISILSNSHVTSALRPVSRSKRTTAASGQVVFSTRSFMFSPPCSAKGYPPPWRCHERRQQRSGPTFPSWARSTPATLLLCRFLVNRDEHPAADPGRGNATEPGCRLARLPCRGGSTFGARFPPRPQPLHVRFRQAASSSSAGPKNS
jgi:hypothetical protein